MLRRILSFVLLLCVVLGAPAARGDDWRRAGTVRLETPSGARGPVELAPAEGGFEGEVSIRNEGKDPLVVSRIVVRTDAVDPRVPPRLVVRLAEGSLPVTVAGGGSAKALVRWTPEPGIRQRQLFGHVVVTTSDERSGEVAMGVHAELPGRLGALRRHALSLLLLAPVIGALFTMALRARGRRDDRTPHAIATAALAVQGLFAAWIHLGFSADVSRLDGNDGLQFVERVVWIRALPAEIHLGVDGLGAVGLLVTSAVAFFAMLPARTVPSGTSGYHAAFLVLDAAVCGVLVAMDGVLLLSFAAVAVFAAVFLVGAWGGSDRRATAARLSLVGVTALALLAVSLFAAARHADPTFLVDGTRTTTSFSIPELSRVAFDAKDARLFGVPLAHAGFALVLAASAALMAAFPLHGWLRPALVSASAPAAALVSLALPTIGAAAFFRLGVALFPEGMRWASGVVVATGAVTAAFGALSACSETDLRRLVASAATAQAGFVLLGAGSLTPQGMSGALVTVACRALSCSAVLLLAGVIDDRVKTRDLGKLEGVATQMPGLATALSAAALGQAGALGLGGAWGPLLAILGALPTYAPLAIAAAVALAVLVLVHLSAIGRIAFGRLDPAWASSPYLEPFGGRLPDLTSREWTGVGPLVAMIVVLGLWPAPLLAVTAGTARDLANAVSPPGPDQIALGDLTSSASSTPAGSCRPAST